MKKTQKQFVIDKLLVDGFISRNYCLANYISRLGALICVLKDEGWEIEGKWIDGDYYYDVKGSPLKKVVYTIPGMEDVEGNLKKLTIYK